LKVKPYIEKNILNIQNIEIIESTPVLDIKPYIPEFTTNEKIKIGWVIKLRSVGKIF